MCLHSKEIILEGKICLKLDYNQRTKIKAISGVLNNEKKHVLTNRLLSIVLSYQYHLDFV